MKRIFKIAAVLCFVFLLVGCGSSGKKLSCTKDYSEQLSQGITMIQDVEVTWSGDKVSNLIMVMHFELPSSLASYTGQLLSTMEATYQAQYGKYNGVKVAAKQSGDTKFDITIEMYYTKVDDESKKAMGFVGSEDYTTNKQQFEQQGYTCK